MKVDHKSLLVVHTMTVLFQHYQRQFQLTAKHLIHDALHSMLDKLMELLVFQFDFHFYDCPPKFPMKIAQSSNISLISMMKNILFLKIKKKSHIINCTN